MVFNTRSSINISTPHLMATAILMATICKQVYCAKQKICVFGGGAFGTSIASKIATSVSKSVDYDGEVGLWVYEEIVQNRNLTDCINTDHCNVKYLPGVRIPDNVHASSDLEKLSEQADIAVFAIPRKFLAHILSQMKGKTKPSMIALSLIKGLDFEGSRPVLTSEMIRSHLSHEGESPTPVAVLMGANVASDVMSGAFVESTLSCEDVVVGERLKALLDSPSFSVELCSDVEGVELCGALKNVVAMAAGFCDAVGAGPSSKSAVIRRGLLEMSSLGTLLARGFDPSTLLRSCGVADVVASSLGGRNRLCAKEFAQRRLQPAGDDGETDAVVWQQVLRDLLHGQELEGLKTCREIAQALSQLGLLNQFPLFRRTYEVAYEGADPHQIFSWQ